MQIKDIQLKHDLSEQDKISFADDLFGLQLFARNLYFILDSPKPLTIIIDGGWGTGKTVFAKQLDSILHGRSHYINVFAHDYQDDVFTAILLSIKKAVKPKEESNESFNKTPWFKTGFRLINQQSKKWTGIDIQELTEEDANVYIENVEKRQEILHSFRNELKQHMEQEKRPVIILVDELDRCKPKYALQVLETIKHLYSVPNLHFVLIMNTKQIINTIRHEHGCNEEDAKIYLQKFYDLMVSMPGTEYSSSNNAYISRRNIKKYIDLKFNEMAEQLRQYLPKLINKWAQTHFKSGFADLAYYQKLSLREINTIFLKLNLIACSHQNSLHIYFYASLLLIQLKESELFDRILYYYKNYDKDIPPTFNMNRKVHEFLSINSITDDEVKKDWNRILNHSWNTAPVSASEHTLSPEEYIEYLTFLTSFASPSKE